MCLKAGGKDVSKPGVLRSTIILFVSTSSVLIRENCID